MSSSSILSSVYLREVACFAFEAVALKREIKDSRSLIFHIFCLFLAGFGLLIFPHIENKYLLFAPMTGFGIAWASMMGVPYLMVVHQIPKERYGVYMAIINMMIVIPMLLQTTTFGYV